jgi:pilus assembly protein CpaE
MRMTRYVLVSDDEQLARRLMAVFGGASAADLVRIPAANLSELPEPLPDVLLLGPDLGTDKALAAAQEIDATSPYISVVMIAEQDAELLPAAMRAGVRDVFTPGASADEMREVLQRATRSAIRRREALQHRETTEQPGGRVLTVVSPKGGSGKTVVAINLAVALAEIAPREVVLVDADLQFGDVASGLGLLPEQTVVDACIACESGGSVVVKSTLTAHPSGLYVLAGASDPASGELVQPAQLAATIRLLAGEFRYVVVDTPANLPEPTLSVIDVSTDLIFVVSMDVPSIRQMRKEITALDEAGLTSATRHLVINRADANVGLSLRDVEETVGLQATATVPSSRSVPLATNQGVALVTADRRSGPARALTQLAAVFVPEADQHPAQRRKLFGR